MNNEKMIKSAKTSYAIVNIIQIIMIMATILIVLGSALLLYAWKTGVPVTHTTMSFGNITLQLAEQSVTEGNTEIPRMLVMMAAGLAVVGILIYGLKILKDILRPMKEGRPFETNVSKSIRKLGIAVLIGGLVQFIAEVVSDFIMRDELDLLQNLFKEGAVEHITMNYSFSIDFLIVGLILFLLSRVFEYGEELQRQSDETL